MRAQRINQPSVFTLKEFYFLILERFFHWNLSPCITKNLFINMHLDYFRIKPTLFNNKINVLKAKSVQTKRDAWWRRQITKYSNNIQGLASWFIGVLLYNWLIFRNTLTNDILYIERHIYRLYIPEIYGWSCDGEACGWYNTRLCMHTVRCVECVDNRKEVNFLIAYTHIFGLNHGDGVIWIMGIWTRHFRE